MLRNYPTEKLARAVCPSCEQPLLALLDMTMTELFDFKPDPLQVEYVEARPLGWRNDRQSVVLEIVQSGDDDRGYETVELGSASTFDIVCPECGRLDRADLIGRVEETLHARP